MLQQQVPSHRYSRIEIDMLKRLNKNPKRVKFYKGVRWNSRNIGGFLFPREKRGKDRHLRAQCALESMCGDQPRWRNRDRCEGCRRQHSTPQAYRFYAALEI